MSVFNLWNLGDQGAVLLVSVSLGSLVLGAVAYFWSTLARRIAIASPARLFRELCKAHRLNRREVALLRRLARDQQLDQPGRLFLEASRFDSVKTGELAAAAQQYQNLKRRLFGNLAESKTAAQQ